VNSPDSFRIVSKYLPALFSLFLCTTTAPQARRRGRPAPFQRRLPWTPAPRP
jgi:hypothetical protein